MTEDKTNKTNGYSRSELKLPLKVFKRIPSVAVAVLDIKRVATHPNPYGSLAYSSLTCSPSPPQATRGVDQGGWGS